MQKIIQLLKEASEFLDEQIRSASRQVRAADMANCQYARLRIQEAITKLLEI